MNKNQGNIHFRGSEKTVDLLIGPVRTLLSYLSPRYVMQQLTLLIPRTCSLLQFLLHGKHDPADLCTSTVMFSADWTKLTGLNQYSLPGEQSWSVSEFRHSWAWSASANGISVAQLQMQCQLVGDSGKRHRVTVTWFPDRPPILATCITGWYYPQGKSRRSGPFPF